MASLWWVVLRLVLAGSVTVVGWLSGDQARPAPLERGARRPLLQDADGNGHIGERAEPLSLVDLGVMETAAEVHRHDTLADRRARPSDGAAGREEEGLE